MNSIGLKTAKIGSLVDIQDSEDPEGLRVFYYLVQDLKVGFTPALISMIRTNTDGPVVPDFLAYFAPL
jgi:hypothetical protein